MKHILYCHACDGEFSVDIDMRADGNHVFDCPHCKHEHCRVVKNGDITSERWDTRNGNAGRVFRPTTSATTSGTLYYDSSSVFTADAWASTSTTTAHY